jgi:hypothetical protein
MKRAGSMKRALPLGGASQRRVRQQQPKPIQLPVGQSFCRQQLLSPTASVANSFCRQQLLSPTASVTNSFCRQQLLSPTASVERRKGEGREFSRLRRQKRAAPRAPGGGGGGGRTAALCPACCCCCPGPGRRDTTHFASRRRAQQSWELPLPCLPIWCSGEAHPGGETPPFHRLCPSGASASGGPFWPRLSGPLLGPPVSSSSASCRTAPSLTGYRDIPSQLPVGHLLWLCALCTSRSICLCPQSAPATRPQAHCGSLALFCLSMPSALDCKPTVGHLLCICLCPRHYTFRLSVNTAYGASRGGALRAQRPLRTCNTAQHRSDRGPDGVEAAAAFVPLLCIISPQHARTARTTKTSLLRRSIASARRHALPGRRTVGQRNGLGTWGTSNATSTPHLLSPPFNHENNGLAHSREAILRPTSFRRAYRAVYSKTRASAALGARTAL